MRPTVGGSGTQSEALLLFTIRLAFGLEPDLVLWRLTQGGLVERPGGQRYRAGLSVNGAADLIGILAPSGRFLALEVKGARGRVHPEQAQWLALVRARGGFAAVVRSVEEARAALGRARRGEHA